MHRPWSERRRPRSKEYRGLFEWRQRCLPPFFCRRGLRIHRVPPTHRPRPARTPQLPLLDHPHLSDSESEHPFTTRPSRISRQGIILWVNINPRLSTSWLIYAAHMLHSVPGGIGKQVRAHAESLHTLALRNWLLKLTNRIQCQARV